MKNKKIIYISLGLIIFIFTFSVVAMNNNIEHNIIATSSNNMLSNKKIGWGLKRNNNNEQPDLGNSNVKLLNDYNGIAMGNNQDKYVYLTFDEGYEAGYTAKILDILKQNEIKAAFFITAHYLNTEAELVERMINEGHIVGNHIPDLLMYKIIS